MVWDIKVVIPDTRLGQTGHNSCHKWRSVSNPGGERHSRALCDRLSCVYRFGARSSRRRLVATYAASPNDGDKPQRCRFAAIHDGINFNAHLRGQLIWASLAEHRFSRPVQSATLPPLRCGGTCDYCKESQSAQDGTPVAPTVSNCPQVAEVDCDCLRAVIQACPILSAETKTAILTMIVGG